MTINLEKHFTELNEIIRKVSNTLSPYDNKDLSWLQNKKIRDMLHGQCPKCFFQLKPKYGDPLPYFCVCNRMGIHDPHVISFSIKLAKKLQNSEQFDNDEIKRTISKLQHLHNTYNKDIPKPPIEASIKGKQTRDFSKIKNYLSNLKD